MCLREQCLDFTVRVLRISNRWLEENHERGSESKDNESSIPRIWFEIKHKKKLSKLSSKVTIAFSSGCISVFSHKSKKTLASKMLCIARWRLATAQELTADLNYSLHGHLVKFINETFYGLSLGRKGKSAEISVNAKLVSIKKQVIVIIHTSTIHT